MKTRNTLKLAFASLAFAALFAACSQTSPKTPMDKAKHELSELENKIDSVSGDDPQLMAELEQRLDRLDESIDEIGNDLEEAGENVGEETKEAWENMKDESRELREKLDDWSDKAGDKLEDMGHDIKEGAQDVKESLKDSL